MELFRAAPHVATASEAPRLALTKVCQLPSLHSRAMDENHSGSRQCPLATHRLANQSQQRAAILNTGRAAAAFVSERVLTANCHSFPKKLRRRPTYLGRAMQHCCLISHTCINSSAHSRKKITPSPNEALRDLTWRRPEWRTNTAPAQSQGPPSIYFAALVTFVMQPQRPRRCEALMHDGPLGEEQRAAYTANTPWARHGREKPSSHGQPKRRRL